MPVVKRLVKGSLCTAAEYDGNFELLSSDPTPLAISGVAITANGAGHYSVDGPSASNMLNTVNGLIPGDLVVLCLANIAHAVTLQHHSSGGNLRLQNGAPFTLNSLSDSITLRRRGAVVYEVSRCSVPDV